MKFMKITMTMLLLCAFSQLNPTTIRFINTSSPSRPVWVGVDKNDLQRVDNNGPFKDSRLFTTGGTQKIYWKTAENGPISEKQVDFGLLEVVEIKVSNDHLTADSMWTGVLWTVRLQ